MTAAANHHSSVLPAKNPMPHARILVIVAAALAGACGRIGFDRGVPCDLPDDCASGSCVTGVCCDSVCDGTCATCASGTCQPVPAACTGDCASCEAVADGFSCAPQLAVCTDQCSSAVCAGAGTAFACDLSSCCATAVAPNLAGSCATAPSLLLGDGCRLVYDYASWVSASNFLELMWDEQLCQQGTWVPFDSGTDAVPCSGCAHETRNTWRDSCSSAVLSSTVCP